MASDSRLGKSIAVDGVPEIRKDGNSILNLGGQSFHLCRGNCLESLFFTKIYPSKSKIDVQLVLTDNARPEFTTLLINSLITPKQVILFIKI